MTPYAPIALCWMVAALILPGHLLLGVLGGSARPGERQLAPRDDSVAWLGWCIAAGVVFNSLLLFAWLWALPGTISLVSLSVVQVLASVGLWFWRGRVAGEPCAPAPAQSHFAAASAPERLLFWVALAFALCVALSHILDANQSAALIGDSAVLWSFKARVIQATGGLGDTYVEAMGDPRLRHENYPLFNPLLQVWMFQLRDASIFVAQKLPLQLLSCGLILALAGALRRMARPLVAAVLLTVFASSVATSGAFRFAGGEAMVAFGALLAVDGWLRWRSEGRACFFGLMALGLTLMIGGKTEAAIFLIAMAGALVLRWLVGRLNAEEAHAEEALSTRPVWPALLLPLGALVAGAAFNSQAGFESDMATGKGTGAGFFERLGDQWQDYIGTVSSYFVDHALSSIYYDGLLFACLAAATLLSLGRLTKGQPQVRDLLVPIATTGAFWLGLFFVYLSTPQPLVWHLETSCIRVLWQSLPLATIALAGLFAAATCRRSAP